MRIAVTGGAGFIGHALVTRAREVGHSVVVLDDLSNASAGGQDELIEIDIAEGVDPQLLRGVETVVHLAAMHFIPACNADPLRCWRSNVRGTENVLESSIAAGVRRLVFSSSAAVYAPSSGALSEDSSELAPIDIYGRSKQACEFLLRDPSIAKQIDVRIARLFNVYGPGDMTPHLIPILAEKILSGEKEIQVGNLDTRRDYVFVGDVASILLKLATLDAAVSSPVNVGTGVTHSGNEVFALLAELTGADCKPVLDASRFRDADNPVLLADNSRISSLWDGPVAFRDGLQELLASL